MIKSHCAAIPKNTEMQKSDPLRVAFLILIMEARGVEPLSEDNAT